MEIATRICLLTIFFIASCASTGIQTKYITDVYVEDFGSDDMERCRPSDVDLSNHEAKEFFLRANEVSYKVIHDHYNYAPCYIEGTLKYKSSVCEWEIRAGATGYIRCANDIKYFACDTCQDLFKAKE